MLLARQVVKDLAVEHGACIRPIQLRRTNLDTGDTNGHFRAFDQQNGKILWDVNLGAEVSGYPVTFAVKGKQYVAVSTGSSLVSGAVKNSSPMASGNGAPNTAMDEVKTRRGA